MPPPQPTLPLVVLDTNAVLDWLVFRNPELAPLASAVAAGAVQWIATAPMREELLHVLGRGHLDPWNPDLPVIEAAWQRHCAERAVPAPGGPPGRLRCSDADDQKFIDLARSAGARWLISRDRAVLKLAKRLREHGVAVVSPADWRPPEPPIAGCP